jgi:carbon storage regulator
MLVLTRKKGESIVIGDDIEIIVADIQGDQVRLGINAPSSISIHRKEVFLEIQEENRKAAEVKMISLKDVLKNRDKEK